MSILHNITNPDADTTPLTASVPFRASFKDKDGKVVFETAIQRDAAERIVEVMKPLPQKERRKVVREIERQINAQRIGDIDSKIASCERDREFALDEAEKTKFTLDVLTDLESWVLSEPVIQRCRDTRVHHLIEAMQDGRVAAFRNMQPSRNGDQIPRISAIDADWPSPGQVFVIEHDWAAAFAKAEGYDDGNEICLPFPSTTFEFRFGGRHVIAMSRQTAATADAESLWFVELKTAMKDGWYLITTDNPIDRQHLSFLSPLVGQIKAICVSLEAEVAETEIQRAPEKLNRARERRGKLPLYDHHVVKLARRSRPVALPDDHIPTPGRKKRLHFRRSHIRRYETHSVRIKWMLVGDPDLGFVDKEYRL